MRRSVGRSGAPVSIPKQSGRTARFTSMGATGQIGSRTDLPHCTPRHRVGEDGARDWPQLSKPESRSQITGRLSPCCIGGLPGISARTHFAGVAKTRGLNPSLQSAWSQYRGGAKARKCRCFFGLAHPRVHRRWTLTLAPADHCGDRPHNVELYIHIFHSSAVIEWRLRA